MKKKNIKKLGLLLATVCGVQVICATTSKGDEAKASFLGRITQTAGRFFRGGAGSGVIPARPQVGVPKINMGPSPTGKVFVRNNPGNAFFRVNKNPGENINYKVKVTPNGTSIQGFKNGQLVSSGDTSGKTTGGLKIKNFGFKGSGIITVKDQYGTKMHLKEKTFNGDTYNYDLKVDSSGVSMQTHKNGILQSGGMVPRR